MSFLTSQSTSSSNQGPLGGLVPGPRPAFSIESNFALNSVTAFRIMLGSFPDPTQLFVTCSTRGEPGNEACLMPLQISGTCFVGRKTSVDTTGTDVR